MTCSEKDIVASDDAPEMVDLSQILWSPRAGQFLSEHWGWLGIVFGLVILWAIYGMTIIHLSVLAWGAVRDRFRERVWEGGRVADVAGKPPLTVGYLLAFRNEELTAAPCIESVLRQSRPADAIVVVNDGSTDGTAGVIERFRLRGVQILHLRENVGKKAALEAGIKLLHTDIVVITDADCIVHPDYVKHILDSFSDPSVDAVTGQAQSIPNKGVAAARRIENVLLHDVVQRAESRTNSIFVLVGQLAAYRREFLLRIGFDHPTMSEDLSSTMRLHALGGKAIINNRAIVHTGEPPTIKMFYRQISRWYTDFWICVKSYRGLFGKKWFGSVELPHVALHLTAVSLCTLGVPLVLLFVAPQYALYWLLYMFALDAVVIGLVAVFQPRRDLWRALYLRTPLRIVSAWVFLWSMARVVTNTHGMRWKKIERHSTAWVLRSKAAGVQTLPRPQQAR